MTSYVKKCVRINHVVFCPIFIYYSVSLSRKDILLKLGQLCVIRINQGQDFRHELKSLMLFVTWAKTP